MNAIGGGGNAFQPGTLRCLRMRVCTQETQPTPVTTADATAQLVDLRDTVALGAANHHDCGLWYIHADFDNCGGHQHIQLSCGKGLHNAVFVLRCHIAVQLTDTNTGQFLPHSVEHRFHRLVEELFFIAGNAGTDNEGAVTLGHFFPNALPGPCLPAWLFQRRYDKGLDLLPSPWQFRQLRYREVAENGHRYRARNRGCRHHQQMRCHSAPSPTAQLVALAHTEAVLLIDNHQPEIEELHALTEQGMRADDNVRLPVDRLQQGCPALLRRHRSRQQSHSHCYSGLFQHRCQ